MADANPSPHSSSNPADNNQKQPPASISPPQSDSNSFKSMNAVYGHLRIHAENPKEDDPIAPTRRPKQNPFRRDIFLNQHPPEPLPLPYPYPCPWYPQCPNRYTLLHSYNCHIRKQHKNTKEPPTAPPPPPPLLRCPFCYLIYDSAQGFQRHTRKSHRDKITTYPCPHCDEDFTSEKTRDNHERSHRNKRKGDDLISPTCQPKQKPFRRDDDNEDPSNANFDLNQLPSVSPSEQVS